ncbi:hypothetical protein CEUSTIGMA_g9330.t1 [Chlamydomonas eustigma]|uniref:Uncharacterized protein n=1 Tax=Chlamydomonas eustigma TaxID=1157962 RepID=A0A250XG58_9CHLO|nr:hypothetical protein CEUSTIGMA_g9330.t1 [Chlamydomonas eustigma]|eukprot:GAX81902.1 hypothetical protein CEUSTIGMA_g9330.t1 [Chlamydomonas eustigma]
MGTSGSKPNFTPSSKGVSEDDVSRLAKELEEARQRTAQLEAIQLQELEILNADSRFREQLEQLEEEERALRANEESNADDEGVVQEHDAEEDVVIDENERAELEAELQEIEKQLGYLSGQ